MKTPDNSSPITAHYKAGTIGFFLFLLLLNCLPGGVLQAQTAWSELTEHGLPNFQGVWNFSSQTPFERPDRYANQKFLSDQEVQQLEKNRIASRQASTERESSIAETVLNNSDARSTGAVNSFWMEQTELRTNNRTSLITHPDNGRLPPVQAGIEIQRGDPNGVTEIPGTRPVRYTHGGIARNGPEDRGLSERCLVFNSGPPLLSGPYNNNLQIFQNADHLVILTEMGFDARIIPLVERPPLSDTIKLWSGDSRGYFEGSSLIVETRNFTDQIASLGMRDSAYGEASNRRLIEKFTLIDQHSMDYEFTIQDPATFTDHITAFMPMTKMDSLIYEYACHAGNYALRNILKGARAEDAGFQP